MELLRRLSLVFYIYGSKINIGVRVRSIYMVSSKLELITSLDTSITVFNQKCIKLNYGLEKLKYGNIKAPYLYIIN